MTIESGSRPAARFQALLEKGDELAAQARRVGDRIKEQASEIFDAFGVTLRSELVAESNRMEHLSWTTEQVQDVVVQNRDLLALEVHAFLEGIKGDPHAYEALGLYKAQAIADEWARAGYRPREFEIRELHGLITYGEFYAGQYKIGFNEISGARHVPPAPADAAEGMRDLSAWLQVGTGHPGLDATVAHAWLAHLHPFDDGNGRLARLLANLALAQSGYPPLILSPSSDRGEYYDALAASDDGDILPLLELFTRVMRRTVKVMARPGYVERVIQDRMLVSEDQKRDLWARVVSEFSDQLRDKLRLQKWDTELQGLPGSNAFHELSVRSADGNGWFLKIFDEYGAAQWLLWFGYNSDDCVADHNGRSTGYPSIFASVRDTSPYAEHPYTPHHDGDVREIVLIPGKARPATTKEGYRWSDYTISEAVDRTVAMLTVDSRR